MNADGTVSPSLQAPSENGDPGPERGDGLAINHEDGAPANGVLDHDGHSGNYAAADVGSAGMKFNEVNAITQEDHSLEKADQNDQNTYEDPRDSSANGNCEIALSDPVSIANEKSAFTKSPSIESRSPIGDPHHDEPIPPRNGEPQTLGHDGPLDNPTSPENSGILLSEPVSMATDDAPSSDVHQHECTDTEQQDSTMEEEGCGLLLSEPISMAADSHTDIHALVAESDVDAQDICPSPQADDDGTPSLEISNVTGSARNCDVSSLLPAKFVARCRENGVAKLLLECSKSSASFTPLSALTELVSVQSSAWEEAGGKSRVDCGRDCRAPARRLVQLRLGYVPVVGLETPDDDELSICANHLQLLTSAFPLDRHCGACRKEVDVATDADLHVISVSMSDRFIRFLPDLMAGQPLCGACHKILVISIKSGKQREYKTEASIANQLKQYQLLRDGEYESVLDSCRERFEACLRKRQSREDAEKSEYSTSLFPLEDWVIFNDSRAPFDTSASKVPPLR